MGDTLAGVCFWFAKQPRVAGLIWPAVFGCFALWDTWGGAHWVVTAVTVAGVWRSGWFFGTGRARPSCSDNRHCDRWVVPLRVSCCACRLVGGLRFLCGYDGPGWHPLVVTTVTASGGCHFGVVFALRLFFLLFFLPLVAVAVFFWGGLVFFFAVRNCRRVARY